MKVINIKMVFDLCGQAHIALFALPPAFRLRKQSAINRQSFYTSHEKCGSILKISFWGLVVAFNLTFYGK